MKRVLTLTLGALLFLAVGADDETGYDDEPALPLVTPETRSKALRRLKRVERRSRKFGIILNRGKMEKLKKGDRLFKVLEEYDRFVSTLEELPEGFVKACGIGTVWFSDEIVDASGSHAGGFASGEGINLSMGYGKGTVYHEMFHKFERCITDQQRREWDELNPEDFFYEGSSWDVFAGNDRQSKRAAERHQKRIAAGKAKSASQKLEESRTKKERRKLAANRANPEIQAAFIGGYAQTTPLEDRACVFGTMMVEGPRFMERARRSEHMRRKMEFMMKLTGKDAYLGRNFWEWHSNVSIMKDPAFADGYAVLDDGNWRKAAPEEMGLDGKKLDEIPALVQRRKMGTTGLMVVVGGKCVYEYGDVGEKSKVHSCGPSLLSMVYGPYVHRGAISLDDTLADLGVEDVGGLERRETKATVRHLLTGRSCCYHPAADDAPNAKPKPRGKMIPGGEFAYNNWGFNVAASVFEAKTEMSVFKAFEEHVARPLRFQDWDPSMQMYVGDTTVSQHKALSFSLSTRDMARVGEVMLRGGAWRGMQVLPRKWVAESTELVSKFKGGGGFGYMWWRENENQHPKVFEGAFSARGLWGQRITVIPKLDMVIAHKSSGNARRPTRGSDYRELVAVIVSAKVR